MSLSPTNSLDKQNIFQFTPGNQTGSCTETSAEKVKNSVGLGRHQKQVPFEDCIVISPSGKRKKISVERQTEKDLACEVGPGVICADSDAACEDGLLTQIIDKKKELDNLIKKWEESREQNKNNQSHIESDIQPRIVADTKELLEGSKGSLSNKQADMKNSDKQQLSIILVDDTEKTTYSKKTSVANPLAAGTAETEHISEGVAGANESNSESCSVKEVPSFSELCNSGVVEHCKSSDQKQQTEAGIMASESEVEMKEIAKGEIVKFVMVDD